MNDVTERGVFRPKARREAEPVVRPFPYPPELTPRGNFGVYLAEGFLGEVFSYARKGDVRNEHFGLILGYLSYDPNRGIKWVELNYLVDTPPGFRSTPLGFEVTAEETDKMSLMADRVKSLPQYEGEMEVGWWHSHPGLGIFFSDIDRSNQQSAHSADWKIGLVVDPIRNLHGMFRGSGCEPIQPFIVPLDSYDIPGSKVFPFKSATFDEPQSRFSVRAKRQTT